MQIRFTVLANALSQAYVTLLGVLTVPVYLSWLGYEAYGLVAFFATLQAWFNLLDMGLTPTLAREASRYQAGALSSADFLPLFHAMGWLFGAIALVGAGLLWFLSPWMQTHWLVHSQLTSSDVIWALRVMALAVALRWLAGLYRGYLTGTDRQVGLAALVVTMATIRYLGVLAAMAYWGTNVEVFFSYQLLASVLETAAMACWTLRTLPAVQGAWRPALAPLRSVLRMGGALAVASSVWVLVNQADKLLLSGLLPLSEYGLFSLTVVLAGGVMVFSAALGQALMPRLSALHVQGDHRGMMALYRRSARWMSAVGLGVAFALASLAEPVLWAWTGDASVASQMRTVLTLYALGYGVACMGIFPYYIQYVRGELRLHVYGNLFLLGLLVPAVGVVAPMWGAEGTGVVWLVLNLLLWMVWGGVVHRRYWPGEHLRWLIGDTCLTVLPSLLAIMLLMIWSPSLSDRSSAAIWAGLSASAVVACNVAVLYWRERREVLK